MPRFLLRLLPRASKLFLATAARRVAAPITLLVSVEVIKGLVPTFRMWTSVPVMRIEAVINMAVEVVRAVEPGAGSDEYTAADPLGPIVSIWGAVVRGEVVVAIRAHWLWSDIDGDLSGRGARNDEQNGDQGRKGKKFPIAHVFLLILEEEQPRCQSGNR